ncbi:hypothetical protein [Methylobacterium sp. P5_C11]
MRYDALAAAFTRVTGHPARYVDVDADTYFARAFSHVADMPAGYNADPADKSTMSFRDNFTGFWNQWKHNVIQRDYGLLDEIHPHRIRSVEQWVHRQEQLERAAGRGGLWERLQPENRAGHSILKLGEDQRRGKLQLLSGNTPRIPPSRWRSGRPHSVQATARINALRSSPKPVRRSSP